MKKVLVTGAAGFIANQVCHQLLKKGVEVVGIDNLNDYYDTRLKDFRLQTIIQNPKFTFYKMDIESREGIKEVFAKHKFDAVFNLAARAGVRASMENPFIYFSTNVIGALNILEEMRGKCSKYILASTSSLYAGQSMPFTEELAVNTPISPYAASKKSAEATAYSYHHLYGIDVSVVRYFTVYGPAGRPDMSIFRFIQWIDKGEKLEVFGDGGQARDFTYVDDIANGTILAAKNVGYQVINLGGGQKPIKINTVIEMIERELGKKGNIDNRDFHKADVLETWADISKAKKILDWEPKVSFEEGISKTIQWYRDNHDFVKSIRL